MKKAIVLGEGENVKYEEGNPFNKEKAKCEI